MLAIGLYDQVRIHLIGEDPNNMSVVHNTISQKVTSLDCNSLQIAFGIHSDDGCMVIVLCVYLILLCTWIN